MIDPQKLTPKEKAAMEEATLKGNPEYTKEELMRMQEERLWGPLEGMRIYKAGEPVPDTNPAPAGEHSWDEDFSDQLGRRQ